MAIALMINAPNVPRWLATWEGIKAEYGADCAGSAWKWRVGAPLASITPLAAGSLDDTAQRSGGWRNGHG